MATIHITSTSSNVVSMPSFDKNEDSPASDNGITSNNGDQDKPQRRNDVCSGTFSRGRNKETCPKNLTNDDTRNIRKARIELMFRKMSANPGSRKGIVFKPDPIPGTNNNNRQIDRKPKEQPLLHYKAEDVYVEVQVDLERNKDKQNPKRVKLAHAVASVLQQELSFIYIAPSKQSSKLVLQVRVAMASDGSRIGRFCGGEMGIGCCKLALNWCIYETNSVLIYKAARFYYEDSLNMGCNDVISCCLWHYNCSAAKRYLLKRQHAWQIVHAVGLVPGHGHRNLNTHLHAPMSYLGTFDETGSGSTMCTEYTDREHVEHMMHFLHDGEL